MLAVAHSAELASCIQWSLGLGAYVGEPAGQFRHTGHAAQLVVEGALFLHAAGLG